MPLKDEPTTNPFREIPLRYLGYANEVGESFRYQFPKLVTPSYAVAFSYCFLDAANLLRKVDDSEPLSKKVAAFGDTLLWQTLASVVVPGGVINVLVKASRIILGEKNLAKPGYKYVPTALGLGCIPFIVGPIDHGVELLMDETIRKMY